MKFYVRKYLEAFKDVAYLYILLDTKKNEILLHPGFKDEINLICEDDIYRKRLKIHLPPDPTRT